MKRVHFLFPLALVVFSLPSLAQEQGHSDQPYIEELKKTMDTADPKDTVVRTPENPDPYIQEIKKRVGAPSADSKPESDQSYIDQLRKTDPHTRPAETESYTEQEKAKLAKDPKSAKENDSAIQAVKENRSELHAVKSGDIHSAAGFRIGASADRTVKMGPTSANFEAIYGNQKQWIPDISLFYEYQPFHSEWFGNLGFFASTGVTYQSGNGKLGLDIPRSESAGGGTFGTDSQTSFKFITIPTMVGVNYRMNLFRVLRPYVQVAPTAIGYIEMRSDDVSGNHGYSKGLSYGGGANLILDWISSSFSWDLYRELGVKHYYLTVDYTKTNTYGGDLQFSVSSLSAGFTYEF